MWNLDVECWAQLIPVSNFCIYIAAISSSLFNMVCGMKKLLQALLVAYVFTERVRSFLKELTH